MQKHSKWMCLHIQKENTPTNQKLTFLWKSNNTADAGNHRWKIGQKGCPKKKKKGGQLETRNCFTSQIGLFTCWQTSSMPLPDEIQPIRMLPFPPMCRNEAITSRIKVLIDDATNRGGSRAVTPNDPTGTNLNWPGKMTTGVQLWTVLPVVIHLLKQATVKAFKGSMQLTESMLTGVCRPAQTHASRAMFR